MLGIVVSLSWELRSLTRQTIPVGSCGSTADNVLVALSGIGAERAYTAGSLLIAQGATALVSWGFAAALDHRLNAGSLILPEHIIGVSGEIHAVSAEWHRRLSQGLSSQRPVHTDALVESDDIVRTPAAKRALAKRTQAIATDMESAAHARLAREHGLPFVALRAIIDTASTDIPEKLVKALDSEGDISVWKLVAMGYIRPRDWLKALQLGIQFSAAQRTLKKARQLVLDSPAALISSASVRR
jgi:adenosylhomocysteine nucleosidase